MKKIIRRSIREDFLTPLLGLHPVLARVYVARGIQSLDDINYQLGALLPFHSLSGIDKAVCHLAQVLQSQQRIVIVGDYDADGATSCALAVSVLRLFGAAQVFYLVPNRFEYGYGLTPAIVAVAAETYQPDLIITVDNGIASCEGVSAANDRGIQVIITDHHLPGAQLPEALAIVNPNQAGDKFPSKCLAGVGVIFYLMLALRRYLVELNWFSARGLPVPNMAMFLDLVALGTVADLVPLDKNNRILVEHGLQRIRQRQCRLGILALLEVGRREAANVTASDLGFALGPRLNAAGRLDDMSLGIECLLCQDLQQARRQAQQLDELNRQRRIIESDMQSDALALLKQMHFDKAQLPVALCLFEPSWHQGVIGILAGRIKDQVHRPVIAFAKASAQELKGSARSVSGLHIRDVLAAIANQNPDLIQKFGGHAMAAGLSIAPEQLATFTDLFVKETSKYLNQNQLQGEVISDGPLSQHDINLNLAQTLHNAGPWGQNFPEPLFDGEFELVDQRLIGQQHLKLTLGIPHSEQTVEAIAFQINHQHWPNYRAKSLKVTYRLAVNFFRGIRSVQLILEDMEAIS